MADDDETVDVTITLSHRTYEYMEAMSRLLETITGAPHAPIEHHIAILLEQTIDQLANEPISSRLPTNTRDPDNQQLN